MNFYEYSYPKQSSLSSFTTRESNSSKTKNENMVLNFQEFYPKPNKINKYPKPLPNQVPQKQQQINFKNMNFSQLSQIKKQKNTRFNNRNVRLPGVKRESQLKNKKCKACFLKHYKEDKSYVKFHVFPENLLNLNIFEKDIHRTFNKEEDYDSDDNVKINGVKTCMDDLEEAFQYIKNKGEKAFVNYNLYMPDKKCKWIKFTDNLPAEPNKK